MKHNILYSSVKDGVETLDIECRFSDGQEYSAISINKNIQGASDLADLISRVINGSYTVNRPVSEIKGEWNIEKC